MSQSPKKTFDLEERTLEFAKRVVRLCRSLPRDPINDRLMGQAVGSSGSIGANYREANDALGKKDFLHRMKISRKEAKETIFWLELVEEANPTLKEKMVNIKQEAIEIKNILSAIIDKTIKNSRNCD